MGGPRLVEVASHVYVVVLAAGFVGEVVGLGVEPEGGVGGLVAVVV